MCPGHVLCVPSCPHFTLDNTYLQDTGWNKMALFVTKQLFIVTAALLPSNTRICNQPGITSGRLHLISSWWQGVLGMEMGWCLGLCGGQKGNGCFCVDAASVMVGLASSWSHMICGCGLVGPSNPKSENTVAFFHVSHVPLYLANLHCIQFGGCNSKSRWGLCCLCRDMTCLLRLPISFVLRHVTKSWDITWAADPPKKSLKVNF